MYSYPEQNLELVSVTSELNQKSHTSLLIISTSPYFKYIEIPPKIKVYVKLVRYNKKFDVIINFFFIV